MDRGVRAAPRLPRRGAAPGFIVRQLHQNALHNAVELPELVQTPYVNSIPSNEQPQFPGDLAIEKKIRAIIRWNAAVMVHRANKSSEGIGGPHRDLCLRGDAV
jgi:pyruvate dehydrogenase complex dehydrogenase (E1) component